MRILRLYDLGFQGLGFRALKLSGLALQGFRIFRVYFSRFRIYVRVYGGACKGDE